MDYLVVGSGKLPEAKPDVAIGAVTMEIFEFILHMVSFSNRRPCTPEPEGVGLVSNAGSTRLQKGSHLLKAL